MHCEICLFVDLYASIVCAFSLCRPVHYFRAMLPSVNFSLKNLSFYYCYLICHCHFPIIYIHSKSKKEKRFRSHFWLMGWIQYFISLILYNRFILKNNWQNIVLKTFSCLFFDIILNKSITSGLSCSFWSVKSSFL